MHALAVARTRSPGARDRSRRRPGGPTSISQPVSSSTSRCAAARDRFARLDVPARAGPSARCRCAASAGSRSLAAPRRTTAETERRTSVGSLAKYVVVMRTPGSASRPTGRVRSRKDGPRDGARGLRGARCLSDTLGSRGFCEVYRGRYRASNRAKIKLRSGAGGQTHRVAHHAASVTAAARCPAVPTSRAIRTSDSRTARPARSRPCTRLSSAESRIQRAVALVGEERDVAEVGAAHGREARRLALGQHAHEALACVGVVRAPRARARRAPPRGRT